MGSASPPPPLGMKYSPFFSVPVSCVMAAVSLSSSLSLSLPFLLSFSHSMYSILLERRSQTADGLTHCSIFRYGPTLRTDGDRAWTVDGCALGLRRRRSKRSTHNENVGAGYCRQSLSFSPSLSILAVVAALRIRFIRCYPSASWSASRVPDEATLFAPVSNILKHNADGISLNHGIRCLQWKHPKQNIFHQFTCFLTP